MAARRSKKTNGLCCASEIEPAVTDTNGDGMGAIISSIIEPTNMKIEVGTCWAIWPKKSSNWCIQKRLYHINFFPIVWGILHLTMCFVACRIHP